MAQLAALLVSLLTLVLSISGVISTTFTIINKCEYTVWPGILSTGPAMSTTGFELQKGESTTITAPASWSGRFWGRTHCSLNSTGKFSCVTGDCGNGKIACNGNSATLPETLAEFQLDGAGGLDFFDVSLVDGYNLPMMIVPQGGTGQNCTTVGCVADLNDSCPSELQVTSADANGNVACMSACSAFALPEYCCTGAYNTPGTCKPSTYSQIFESACPQAYSYAYDYKMNSCASADYAISFCSTSSTRIGSDQGSPQSPPPSVSELCKQGDGGKLYCDEECKRCRDRGGECKPGDNGKLYCDDTEKGNHTKKLAIGLATLFAGIGVVTVLIYCLIKRKFSSNQIIYFWKKKSLNHQTIQTFLRNCGPLAIKRYSHSDIKKMTNFFRDKLGEGGFGGVYKGKLEDGCLVAVKVLKESRGNGEEFINEVASISRTSHVNIVSLMGFCFEGSKKALIYEFMPNGSLEKFIYNKSPSKAARQLEWETLYNIAIGIARGLEYLHRGCSTRILHFDIKPHNILLDENFNPKISDFGLAKICTREESIISMLGTRGTAGYIAPEIFCRNFGGVSHKSDVYSYGMMVFEMVGGRKNIDVEIDCTSEIFFPQWIHKRLEQDEDLGLHGLINEEDHKIVRKMIIVGLWCIQTDPSIRPPMSRVVNLLEGSLESLQVPPKPFLSSPTRLPEDSSTTV